MSTPPRFISSPNWPRICLPDRLQRSEYKGSPGPPYLGPPGFDITQIDTPHDSCPHALASHTLSSEPLSPNFHPKKAISKFETALPESAGPGSKVSFRR
jgi:hypothetical protein